MIDVAAALEPFTAALAGEPSVQGVTVVGSRMSGYGTERSDIDLFVYIDRPHEELLPFRGSLVSAFAEPDAYSKVAQHGHPYSDVLRLRDADVWLDVMFWTTAWAEEELDWRLVRTSPQVGGASTAFWRSIRNGIPLYDRSGWLQRLQARAASPYPEELRGTIISVDWGLLDRAGPFSYSNQLTNAVAEGDLPAAQHRCAAFLTTYFDLLFAANRVLHPGEKRLVTILEAECDALPADLDGLVTGLIDRSARLSPDIDGHIDALLGAATEVVAATDP